MSEFAVAPTGTDVRLLGFATRAAFAIALSWIEQQVKTLGPESIPAASTAHRILAAPVRSRVDQPDVDCAGRDGYAVQASDTEAADSYTPLLLRLTDGNVAWRPGDGNTIAAGMPMPPGTDAVLPFEATARHDGMLAVMAPVAPGAGVRLQGADTRTGQDHLATGRRLRPEDPAFLASLGVAAVEVVRQPKVAVLSIGPKGGGVDLLGPMLLPRIVRDGGLGLAVPSSATIADAASRADLVIVAGRSGCGADDATASTLLAAGGTLALHGIALQPGESTGLGQLHATPLVVLPGEPLACLASYEMLAARVVRRLSGAREPAPAPLVQLGRKVVSTIGMVELVFVRLQGGRATPLAADGLAVMLADGYVVVPETSEGFAAGSLVPFHSIDAGGWALQS